jgi:hypothetical protein
MADIPTKQPEWLQQILDGHQRELNASKNTNDLFLQKFDEMVTSFRADYKALDGRQTEASQKISSIQEEVADLKAENQIRQTDIAAVDSRVDEFKEEVLAKLDDLRNELQAKLDGKVAPLPDRPVVPSTASVGDQCRIDREFSNLMAKAKEMTNCFAMGRTTGVIGFSPGPKTAQQVLDSFFAGIPITLVPGAGKSQVKRFVVDKDRVGEFQDNLELYNQQIRADGWWVSVDYPPELRALRSNAFQFFKEAKALHDTIRAAYLDVSNDSGFVTIDGVEFVPVYMVPRDRKKWSSLIPLMQAVVDQVRNIEWTVRITSTVSIDQAFVRDWANVVGANLTNSAQVQQVVGVQPPHSGAQVQPAVGDQLSSSVVQAQPAVDAQRSYSEVHPVDSVMSEVGDGG